MSYQTEFTCKICEETYPIEMRSEKKKKLCIYCTGEQDEDINCRASIKKDRDLLQLKAYNIIEENKRER